MKFICQKENIQGFAYSFPVFFSSVQLKKIQLAVSLKANKFFLLTLTLMGVVILVISNDYFIMLIIKGVSGLLFIISSLFCLHEIIL